ncbi:cysteine hydrolase family protein [Streptomyces avicenniae]|uniref:cysteine hydrolase family protein n=1 Tax=Streptomyces avicenniae TaxID=500153 RepID=UPI00069AFCDB|nr:cysteine hydrolase [Streptomyces avicenniae]
MTTPSTPTADARTTALLVMDFEPAVLGSLPRDEADALVERVAGAVADVRAKGGTIGYVRVALTDADYDAVPATNKAFAPLAAHRGRLDADAPGTAVDARIAPRPGDIEVRKVRFGAFSTTDLAERLRERGITTLVLAGISTSGVVLSTVIDAADRDYRLYVLSDGVADTRAAVHDVLVGEVFPSRAHVIDTAALRGLLTAA